MIVAFCRSRSNIRQGAMGPNIIHRFWQAEDAAVTADWVVLCAAIIGFALATVLTLSGAVSGLGGSIGTTMVQGSVTAPDLDAD